MPIDYGEGERGEMIKTLAEPRVRSNFFSLMMAARVRSNFFSLMMAASTSQLGPGRSWKENTDAKMRRRREDFNN